MRAERTSIVGIQYLRALAALAVVVYHANQRSPWAHGGARGVDVFFVISGFIMAYTTPTASDWLSFRAPVEFLRRRLLRIVPLYWIALTITAVLGLRRWTPDLRLVLDYLFIAHKNPIIPTEYWPLLIPGWTLNFEMYFYLLFAASLLAGRFSKSVCIASIVTFSALGAWLQPTNALSFYSNPIALEFVAGMLIALAHRQAYRPSPLFARIGLMVSVAALLSPRVSYLPLDAPLAAWLVWSSLHAFPRKPWSPAVLLGNASYALYLVHTETIGLSHKLIFKPLHLSERFPGGELLESLLCISACVIAGIVFHRRVELPLQRWLDSVSKRSQPRPFKPAQVSDSR